MSALQQLAAPILALSFTGLTLGCRPEAPALLPSEGSTDTPAVTDERPAAESAGLTGPGSEGVAPVDVVDEGPPGPVVLFTSGLLGYTEPCGCTIDLVLGGIDRVTGYVRARAALATDHLMLDAGNLLFEHESIAPQDLAQEIRKTEVLMAAHREMGTAATVIGPMDLANGLGFYLDVLSGTEIVVLASNMTTAAGEPIGLPHQMFEMAGQQVGVIGAADPALFDGVDDVVVTEALPAVSSSVNALRQTGAGTTVLLYQGDLASARTTFAEVEGLDFLVIGYHPRRTDEVTRVGSAFVLEAYDQGRTVGQLKLISDGSNADWTNARAGSSEEQERLDRLIESTRTQLDGIPIEEGAPVPPIVERQRERLAELEAQRASMNADSVAFTGTGREFLFRPIDMEPGLPSNEAVAAAMTAYNAELQAINMASARAPEPARAGQPHYVGDAECVRCHTAEHEFWLTTQHSHAIATLVDRNKHFDRNCVGCHVTGWEQPGGSTLGHTAGLENVQCEQCHGPGSMHIMNPNLNNVPTGVQTAVPESTCVGCHNSEHSPRFNYDTYLSRVIGPGHGAPSAGR